MHDVDVIVIGAGAAGIAAARRLVVTTRLSVRLLEARDRVGGRAWTLDAAGFPLDLGCGWLHSAEHNEWSAIAQEVGFEIDPTPPPWSRRAHEAGFPLAEQDDFAAAWSRFQARVAEAGRAAADRPASELLEPGGRWNPLLDALSSYINGVELDRLSVADFVNYRDSGINWRVVSGYGRLIEAYARGLDVTLNCPVTRIDHSGGMIRVITPRGVVKTRAVILAIPPTVIASEALRFVPALPQKLAAAHALPLGLADKVFLRVDDPRDLPTAARLFGATDRVATGSYHLRPFGRPLIEGYFGGRLAEELEHAGESGFAAFAIDQIAKQLGADIRKRLHPLAASAWRRDPFAGGSYSYAKVGHSDARGALAAAVDGRLFFAGEACSRHDFSTAHGAYRTGVQAADDAARALSAYSGELGTGSPTRICAT